MTSETTDEQREAKRQRDSREEKIREKERWRAREEDQNRQRLYKGKEQKGGKRKNA